MPRHRAAASERVSKAELAKELNLTPRRIGQMINDFVLPPPGSDDLFDLETCERQYQLFRRADDDEWLRWLETDVADLGREATAAFKRAMRPTSTLQDCQAAAVAHNALIAALRCFCSCRMKPGVREMLLEHHARQDSDSLRMILTRIAEISAAEDGTTVDATFARWNEELKAA